MIAYGILVIIQVLLVFTIAGIFFGMELGNSYAALFLITLVLALVVSSMGLMIAALVRSGKQAESIGMVLGFLLAGLGGCITLGSITPVYLQDNTLGTISQFTPHAHALYGYYKLMVLGSGFVDILPQVGILLVFSLVFMIIAAWRLRFQ